MVIITTKNTKKEPTAWTYSKINTKIGLKITNTTIIHTRTKTST